MKKIVEIVLLLASLGLLAFSSSIVASAVSNELDSYHASGVQNSSLSEISNLPRTSISQVETGNNSADFSTDFDPLEYPHCYSKIIYDTIQKMKVSLVNPMGTGVIYDIDNNGVKELIITYREMSNYGASEVLGRKCSVYTMSNGQAIPLISGRVIFVEAGQPSYLVGVAEKDGKNYIYIENENAIQGKSNGFWEIYSIDGDNIAKIIDSTFECYKKGSQIIYSSSMGVINNVQYSYSDYLEEKAAYKITKIVLGYPQSEDVMDLEELLEYTKSLPVESEKPAETGNTLKSINGELHYYVNGKFSNITSLVSVNNTWYYVKNGVVDNSNTLVQYGNKWYHVNGGKWVKDTTLVKYGNYWCYVKDGIKDNEADTLVEYNGKYYHVSGGVWVKDTTIVRYNNQWFSVKDGIKTNFNSIVKRGNKWYHVNGGKWVKDTTLVKYGKYWCYVKDGIKDNEADTLVKYNGKYYHVSGGVWVKDTTIVRYNNQWFSVKDGIKANFNSLVRYGNKWYHVNGGKWVKDTTLVKYGSKYYYVKDGVKTNITGTIKIGTKTYELNNGVYVK